MAKKKNKKELLLLLLLLGIVIFIFFFKAEGEGKITYITPDREEGDLPSSVAAPDAPAITPHFAGEDKKDLNLFSIISVEGGANQSNIFYMYYDVQATLVGVMPTTVWIDNVQIIDDNGNGRELNRNFVLQAWGCMLNDQTTLTPAAPTFVWDPYTCSGDGAWLDTTIFEEQDSVGTPITQPLLIRFTMKGEYSNFLGIVKEIEKVAELHIFVQSQEGYEAGGFEGEVIFSGDDFIELCNESQTQPCEGADILFSACEGTMQTCTSGLWPGCRFVDYQTNGLSYDPNRNYTGSSEFSGGSDWIAICTDGIDNDCDGKADRAGANGMLRDPDCPLEIVTFRTNAMLNELADDVWETYAADGIWTAADQDGDNYLESFDYRAVTSNSYATAQACYDDIAISGKSIIGYTPLNLNNIVFTGGSQYFICAVGTDGNYERLRYEFEGLGDACGPLHADYPTCLNIYPSVPYSLNNQERTTTY